MLDNLAPVLNIHAPNSGDTGAGDQTPYSDGAAVEPTDVATGRCSPEGGESILKRDNDTVFPGVATRGV